MEADINPEILVELNNKSEIAIFARKDALRLILERLPSKLAPEQAAEALTLHLFYELKSGAIEKELQEIGVKKAVEGIDDNKANADQAVALALAKEGDYSSVRELYKSASIYDYEKEFPLIDREACARVSARFSELAEIIPDHAKPFEVPPNPWDDQRIVAAYRRSISPLWTPEAGPILRLSNK